MQTQTLPKPAAWGSEELQMLHLASITALRAENSLSAGGPLLSNIQHK